MPSRSDPSLRSAPRGAVAYAAIGCSPRRANVGEMKLGRDDRLQCFLLSGLTLLVMEASQSLPTFSSKSFARIGDDPLRASEASSGMKSNVAARADFRRCDQDG